MAERRMFSKKITDSDAFIELSSPTQALYFHLNQGADDDGFNNQVQNAMFKAHASIDDLKVLLMKNFIIRFESGVIVIKHWRMHNTLRKDRYTPTSFQEEFNSLGIKDNGSYTLSNNGCQMVAKWLPQDSIGKNSIGKDRKKKKNSVSVSVNADELETFFENFQIDNIESRNIVIHYLNNGMTLEVIKNGLLIPYDRNIKDFDFENEIAPIEDTLSYGLAILKNWDNFGVKTLEDVKRYNKLNRNRETMINADE